MSDITWRVPGNPVPPQPPPDNSPYLTEDMGDARYERSLGDPAVDLYVLASLASGVRLWVPQNSGGAPTDATYIVQVPNGSLSAEQALSALATGIVKNTTATGILSIAVADTDYATPELVALKAPLASPALTGTPTAPTAGAGTSTTQVATTAFSTGALATHEADTTNVHGIVDTAALLTTSSAAGGDLSGTLGNLQLVANAVGTTEIANSAVSYAKLQAASASVVLGSAAGGVVSELAATAAGRAILAAADNAAIRVLLGLVIGTNVQAFDTDLAALAGLVSAADQLPYFTGSGTAALTTLTSYIRTVLAAADSAAARALLDTIQASRTIAKLVFGGTTYCGIPGVILGSQNTAGLTANEVRYFPFYVDSPVTIVLIQCEITTQAAGGKFARMGICTLSPTTFLPLTQLLDSGNVVADTLGVKAVAVSQPLAVGPHAAFINTDGTPTVRTYRGNIEGGFALPTMGSAGMLGSLRANQTFGAFPSPTPTAATSVVGSSGGIDFAVELQW